MRLAVAAVLALGCTPPKAPAPPDPILTAIDTGDFAPALHALCAAYAKIELPCADTLTLELLGPNDVMSRVSHEDQIVYMQPMPKDGFAYWDNWSTILAGGAWKPRALFADEREARRIANTLLVSVLAHELGHHVASRHGCSPWGGPGEMRADELSSPIVRELVPPGLHRKMRVIADAMIGAVPAETRMDVPSGAGARAWIAARELPEPPAAYASLHLSRQRAVLAEGTLPREAAESYCLPAWRTWLSTRKLAGNLQVRTVATLPKIQTAAIAIDRAGRVWGVFEESNQYVLRRLDAKAPERRIAMPEDPGFLSVFAIDSEDRFALSNRSELFTFDANGGRKDPFTGGIVGLAYDDHHELLVGTSAGDAWVAKALDGTVRFTIDADASAWGDGARTGTPREFDVAGDRLVYYDVRREAIRALGTGGTSTLAGSRPGRRDGPAATAELFNVQAVRILADGRVMTVEESHRDDAIRVITK